MNKKYKLKNKQKFNEVIKTGKKLKNKNYVIYFLPAFELKIGITVGKKSFNSPQRNYHKRVIRSICQQNIQLFPQCAYIIIGRENLSNQTHEQKVKTFVELIERIKSEQ